MLDVQDKAPETKAEAPSLKADDLGSAAMGSAASAQMHGGDVGPAPAGPVRRKAGAAAADGFRGSPGEVPYRAEMEHSFGADFGGVQAYTDRSAQGASRELNAHAYAVGNQVAFGSSNPDKATVAHELTHVLQHGGGKVQAKSSGAGDTGAAIDKSGEGEAEKVESAVAAGKPARSALEGGAPKQGGPRLRAGRGIARKEGGGEPGAPFTFGMSFSREGMEKQYWWNIWKSPHPFEVPIPAVPGLNFRILPSVRAVAAGGVNWKATELEAQLKLLGMVELSLGYGNAEIAEIYGGMEAAVEGGFEYKHKSESAGGGEEHADHGGEHAQHAPEGEHAAAHQEHAGHPGEHAAAHEEHKTEAKRWSLEGAIGLATNFVVGVSLGGGWVDYRYEFGKCDIGKLVGLSWKDGKFDSSAVGWEWGEQPKAFFASVRHVIQKAMELKKHGVDAFKKGMQVAKDTGQKVYSAARDVVQWATSW